MGLQIERVWAVAAAFGIVGVFTACASGVVELGGDSGSGGAGNGAGNSAGNSAGSTGSGSGDCSEGEVRCEGECVDPLTDAQHCGAAADCTDENAGTACEEGYECDGQGACAPRCSEGEVRCEGECVDPLTDAQHCGASGNCTGENAGTPCSVDQTCQSGICCAAQLLACDGQCVDPSANPLHCGSCNNACPSGVACSDGSCLSVYSEQFFSGQTATAQCGAWDSWRATLTGSYKAITVSGSYDPVGVTCNDPIVATALANALRDNTSYAAHCNGRYWSLCDRYKGELWIDPPALCSPSNCPNPGYILRPCFSGSLWGAVNAGTCSSQTQTMTVTLAK